VPASCGGGEDSTTAGTSTTSTSGASEQSPSDEPHVYFGFIKALPPPAGENGAVVGAVQAGSPVANAGLRRGDLIVSVDGEPVATAEEASAAFAKLSTTHDPGDQVEVSISRQSGERTLKIAPAPNAYLGAEVQNATGGDAGVLVVSVPPGGPAEKAGVKPDDLITAVDGTSVASVNELFAALGEHVAGEQVELTLSRGSKQLKLTVTVTDRTVNR
jgi:S1-C subfamily serine protease